MRVIRREKLNNLIAELIQETERLGYSYEEVENALIAQLKKETK
jgi:DNA-binding transcriptional regulator YhcF (GntR family)